MTNILIVEDLFDWQDTIARLLKKHDENFNITCVSSETEARRLTRPKFDVAIIDLRLHSDDPDDKSGLELAMFLRGINPHIKMILVSGHSVQWGKIYKPLRYSGFTDFVEKPQLDVELIKKVNAALNEPSYEKNTSQLSLFIENGQPIWLRAWGDYVVSIHTHNMLDMRIADYISIADDIYGLPRSHRRRYVKNIGDQLYEKVFKDDIELLQQFTRAETIAKTNKRLLNISFEISRELVALPLEFMFIREADYLILDYPVTRFITGISPDRKALSPEFFSEADSLRILLIGSNTEPDIPGVDVEIEKLRQLLQAKPEVEIKVIPTVQATLAYVEQQITDWQPDIVHYAGHGFYDPESTEESSLYFWSEKNKQGQPVELKAIKLKSLFQDSTVRLVYLSCCEGTMTGDKTDLVNDDFLGIADAIIKAGVPSVLGSRWPLSDKKGTLMAEKFYESLLGKGSLPIALLEARKVLANDDRDDFTWLSPILIHQT